MIAVLVTSHRSFIRIDCTAEKVKKSAGPQRNVRNRDFNLPHVYSMCVG